MTDDDLKKTHNGAEFAFNPAGDRGLLDHDPDDLFTKGVRLLTHYNGMLKGVPKDATVEFQAHADGRFIYYHLTLAEADYLADALRLAVRSFALDKD